jgi:hypothetical protein
MINGGPNLLNLIQPNPRMNFHAGAVPARTHNDEDITHVVDAVVNDVANRVTSGHF